MSVPASEQKKSINGFRCQAEELKGWSKEKAKAWLSKSEYKVSSTPYPGLSLVQSKTDALPDKHYDELISFFAKNKFTKKVYVQSCPIYPLLILAAALP